MTSLDPNDVAKLKELLETNRNTLAIHLKQRAQHGEAYTPPATFHGIEQCRGEIRRIKGELRRAGVSVPDHPNDEDYSSSSREVVVNAENLKNRDYYFIIDKSGSMSKNDTQTGMNRYEYVQESIQAFANVIEQKKYDPDRITVVLFSGRIYPLGDLKSDNIKDIFLEHQPMGGTLLAPALEYVFGDYLKKEGDRKDKREWGFGDCYNRW